jgi:(E)-4-hydroxy-3-methylbut-2-enyl-diphosphate synthase
MIERRITRKIKVGGLYIGGDSPITVQSMTNTSTDYLESTLAQCRQLITAGCDIIRISFPTLKSTESIPALKAQLNVPLVADVHFNAKIALSAIEKGIDKIRINPGNIGNPDEVKAIAREALQRGIPIRVGVNSGSLPDDLENKYKGNVPIALREGALRHVRILEDVGFDQIVIAVKSTSVLETIEAYKLISKSIDYPLHLGVTEAGTLVNGTIRSTAAMAVLISEGIGDTLRVSLCSDPVNEVKVGIEILRSFGLKKRGIHVIACPTCARTEIDVQSIAEEVEKRVYGIKKELTVAVMGCVVNGPGEAKHADLGIAGGEGKGVLFRRGEKVRVVKESEMVDVLVSEIESWESGD